MDRVNIDVSRYIDKRKAKTASVVKLNGVVHYIQKTFDQATGEPTSQAVPLTKEAIENSLKEMRDAVANLEALFDDFKKAPEKITDDK